jgi:hypothetical protein
MAAHAFIIGLVIFFPGDVVTVKAGFIGQRGSVVGIVGTMWRVNRHPHRTAKEQQDAQQQN